MADIQPFVGTPADTQFRILTELRVQSLLLAQLAGVRDDLDRLRKDEALNITTLNALNAVSGNAT